jgi:hypothetical protein
VLSQLFVAVVMVAPDGGLFQGPVHPLDLTVRPRMVRFGQPVFDPVLKAAHIEHMRHIPGRGPIGISWREGELSAGRERLSLTINVRSRENRVDFVRNGFNQGGQESGRGHAVCFFSELGEGKFTGPVDCHEQEELSFLRLNLSNIDVKIADRVGFKSLPGRLVAFHIRQTADAMALIPAMQGRARQMRDRRLKRIEAVIERQGVCLRKATAMASSSTDNTVERGSFGPMGASWTKARFFWQPSSGSNRNARSGP